MAHPPIGRIVVAVLFTLFGLSAWSEALDIFLRASDDPTLLGILQTVIGAVALTAAVGSWRGSRWSPVAAIAYGVITAGMIVGLGPMLGLEGEERGGLLVGAAAVLLIALAMAWYLRRAQAPRDGTAPCE